MDVPIVRVELRGNLTRSELELALAAAEHEAAAEDVLLLVDCLQMTSYETDAREYFVEWHKKMDKRIARTAVALNQPVWRIVVSAMGLAAHRPMAAFDSVVEAEVWLQSKK